MALIWADNFEMYGGQEDRLLDGIYASHGAMSLGGDPGDTYAYINVHGSFTESNLRFVLPTPRTTVGQGGYFYFDRLPVQRGECPAILSTRNTSNSDPYYLVILPDGRLTVRKTEVDGADLYTTVSPVMTAQSDIHVEMKIVKSVSEGSIEVRVRGRTVLKVEGIDTGADSIGQVAPFNQGGNNSTGGAPFRLKHWTIWDGTGTQNNDFLGQVQVFWNDPVENITDGGWTSNAGSSAANTLTKPRLANQLTASGDITSGNQIRIANTYYNWTSGDVNAGAPAGTSTSPWLVAMGVDTTDAISNMYNAINASGVAGTTYSSSLTEHPTVKGFGIVSDAFCVIPKVPGTVSTEFSETGSNITWASTSSFLNHVWDTIRMSSGYISGDPITYPDAFKVKLRILPDDVTSIRAVLPIIRAAKIDGGDGNIQVSFGTSEDSYDDGPDTPLTNAFTYWGNSTDPFVSEINPDTGLPWTPSEFNLGARIKVQRTL